MWNDLSLKQRRRYEKLILNFASLSEAFAQKEENEDSIVAPIVNSKFQETAFQKCFNACAEDIANTSYDASINSKDKKYLVGIKTFGLKAGDQKIAQFKSIAGSSEWASLINEMQENANGLTSKKEINSVNHDLYLELAKKIAYVRNERIKSSKENLRGFKLDGIPVEAVYHVLMPSSKNENPKISVGEISYSPININNIHNLQCTTPKKPQNFTFSDGLHEYKWSATDSQLFMKFHNTEIALETWPVHYVDDAFKFFENMGQRENIAKAESHSWFLTLKPYSGFNAFMGQPKMARKNNNRENKIQKLLTKYENELTDEQLAKLSNYLKNFLLRDWRKDKDKPEMVSLRKEIISFVQNINNKDLTADIRTMVYRPATEFELRIPESRQFHQKYPHFFTSNEILQPNSKKCAGSKEDRAFNLRFIPSGDEIKAYIGQENGKAIESLNHQTIMGDWVLRDIFQLKPYEPLTQKRLKEMGINAVRLTKRDDAIELAFTWIDLDNKPDDLWEPNLDKTSKKK